MSKLNIVISGGTSGDSSSENQPSDAENTKIPTVDNEETNANITPNTGSFTHATTNYNSSPFSIGFGILSFLLFFSITYTSK